MSDEISAKDVPVLHLVYEEVNMGTSSRLWVYDGDKNLVGQLYTTDVQYEKKVHDRGTIWVGFPSDGHNIIEGMNFKF